MYLTFHSLLEPVELVRSNYACLRMFLEDNYKPCRSVNGVTIYPSLRQSSLPVYYKRLKKPNPRKFL